MKNFLSWVEINKAALLENIASFRKLTDSKVKFLAVVKGNAYGHGLVEIAKIISAGRPSTNSGRSSDITGGAKRPADLKDQVDLFGVNSLGEALILKKLKVGKPILILGYTQKERLSEVVKNKFHQVVYNLETAKTLKRIIGKQKTQPFVHLKIEVGTNRQGTENSELLEIAKILSPAIIGASIHFANVEENGGFYQTQIKRFERQLKLLRKVGINPKILHTACTAAAILYPETHFSMVRVGIGLYGLWPSELTQELAKRKNIPLELKPVLSWKTRVVQVKSVKKGETIGYGRTYKSKKDMKIAILPIGYFDGFDRGLSNIGRVLVKGKFASILGSVMMNMIIVDVTDVPNLKVENEVVLIGKQGRNEITVEELAEKIGTINYEVVTRINHILPRIIV